MAFYNARQQALIEHAGIHGFVERQRIDLLCVAEVASYTRLSDRELAAAGSTLPLHARRSETSASAL